MNSKLQPAPTWILDSSLVSAEDASVLKNDDENTFEVTVTRNGLGLGFSIMGGDSSAEFIRIKKIFPLQPAWETGKLRPGDILLKVSGIPLSSLSLRQALDILRSSPSSTVLTVCRPFSGGSNSASKSLIQRSYSFTPLVIPPPSMTSTASFSKESSNGLLKVTDPIGEFEVVLNKTNGSLGFSLKASEDTTILRHSVKAVLKDPALSDGRIQPGDKLLTANNVDCSIFSHQELIQFLRQCPDQVSLRFYRDASRSQTPITSSPEKPFNDNFKFVHNNNRYNNENNSNNNNHSNNNYNNYNNCINNNYDDDNDDVAKHKMLRHEAMEMVRSLQASRTSLHDYSNSSSTSSLHRRGFRPHSPRIVDCTDMSSSSLSSPSHVLSSATSLPIIESPVTPTTSPSTAAVTGTITTATTTSLPPIFITSDQMENLRIEDVTDDLIRNNSTCISGGSSSSNNNNNNGRPRTLDLFRENRKKQKFEFRSFKK